MWRVYKIFRDGKSRCVSRSFERWRCEVSAFMLALGLAGPDVAVVEMRSPDGRVWPYTMPRPSTPKAAAEAAERLKALPPEEFEARRDEAKQRVNSYFTGEPKPSPAVERAMEFFRQKMAEKRAQEAVTP